VRDTAKFLGAGVANLLNIFNPDTFVILGGVTLAGDHLFVPLQAEIKRRAFKPAVEVCRIVPCELTQLKLRMEGYCWAIWRRNSLACSGGMAPG